MRYGDGGGLSQAARVRRERVRSRAADLFTQGVSAAGVAARLEVSQNTAYRWQRAWRAGGVDALASKGPCGPDPKLSDEQLELLKACLMRGPAAAGHEDQRWTLARIAALAGRMFKVRVSVTTAWEAMRRIGFSPQMPTTRAIERDEQAIARWRRHQWPAVKESRAG